MGRQNWNFSLTDTCTERHRKPVYCVSFNLVDPAHRYLFASCGGKQVIIHECLKDGSIEPLQIYQDESNAEEFYTVKWTVEASTGAPLLLAGGKQGVVRVLDCSTQAAVWTAVGHGQAINDVAVHPQKPDLFLTASKDCSLRLWNLKTRTCVLMASGEKCHTNEVLSIVSPPSDGGYELHPLRGPQDFAMQDFHPLDEHRFLSSGMDDTIKIWWLQGNEKDIRASYEYDATSGRSFRIGRLTAPIFSTGKVHGNYVDCVRWMGDLVLSKSMDSRVLMWTPAPDETRTATSSSGPRYDRKGRVDLVQEYIMEDADIWFIRFAMDPTCRVLACGSRTGKVFVWDLLASSNQAEDAGKAKAVLRVASKAKCTVRQVAVSRDCSIIVACCDDGSICRFDANRGGSAM